MITNRETGTNISEVTDRIYRINTAATIPGGTFSFNQYLIVDDEPLLFHTGPRGLFTLVREAVASVLPPERLRHISFSHVEADECGSLNDWLKVAPDARPLCGRIAAMVSINDMADRPPRALADGETVSLGERRVRWIDTPHLPHGWEAGYLFEETTRTLFCGDLFTQPGSGAEAVTKSDIVGPSEAFRGAMDYYSHAKDGPSLVGKLAETEPALLACMHGSAWRGDGGALLRILATQLAS
jgi:flavorubredoxin